MKEPSVEQMCDEMGQPGINLRHPSRSFFTQFGAGYSQTPSRGATKCSVPGTDKHRLEVLQNVHGTSLPTASQKTTHLLNIIYTDFPNYSILEVYRM